MIKIKNLAIVIFVMILSTLLTIASFGAGNPEAYLFPRIISSIMMFLAILLLIFHFNEKHHQDQKINIVKLAPFFILIVIFILLGENLGFYLSTSLIFLIISFVYFPEKKNFKNILLFIIVGFCFMCVIYFLFTFLLKVQVPRFFLF